MSYHSVSLGIVGSPGVSPRGEQNVLETFYYTLVFPVPSAREMPRISYSEVCEMLRGVTAGGRAREARAIEELRAAWEAKFRSGAPMAQDMIPFSALQELMRDVIIARFSALSGMTVRPRTESLGNGRILLSFRPSPAMLRATAERLKVRVPASIALEIDSKPEAKLWGQAEAQEEIYRLFLAGKITAEDAQIFDYEDSGMWTRRLRALQRFSTTKTSGQAEEEVVYLPFRALAALRYVYRQIDDEGDGGGGMDGSTLSPFRMVDKIRLTKALIDAEFDCDALLERGLLDHHLCPHTYRTTDVDTSLDVLRAKWGALPSPWRVFCGPFQCFHSSAPAADPLLHVRNYFGEQLALYFSFASFNASALRTLGFVAFVLAVIATKTSRPRETEAAFCLCSCAFLGIFVRKWELQEARLAARWSGSTPKDGGNAVNPLLQLPRPQFRGQMRRSPVTLRLEPYSPVGKEVARRLVSALVLVALTLELGASNAVLVASNRFQALATETSSRFNVALGVIALISKCATPHLARCSRALTNWENHRLQRDYDSQLTFKFAVLQSANCFGALWGLAFLRPLRCRLGQCRHPDHAEINISSNDQAAHMLLILLGLDVAVALWGIRWAVWKLIRGGGNDWRHVSTETAARPLRMVERATERSVRSTATLLTTAPTCSSVETDLLLVPYEGVLFDYAQVLVPLGFVAWFAPLAPLSCCVLAWTVAALQIRVDAHSLCYDTQRPFPIQALSLGSWLGYLHVLRIGAVLHSTVFMLMIFLDTTAADLDNKTFEQRVVALGALFACVGWVAYALKDHQDLTEERHLKLLRIKQAALESKYLGHLGTHLAASAKATLPPGRIFLNGVPRYVVTGDKGEEDAAEELRDQWRQQQMQMLGLEKRVAELRDSEDDTPSVGVLYVEVQGVSLLPIASPIHSFVQFCVQSGTVGTGSGSSRGDSMSTKSLEASKKETGGRIASPLPAQMANTSVSKKSRSPLWHESFELPVTALGDVLALRVCDGGPIIPSVRQRRVLGRAQLGIEDVITRTNSTTAALPPPVSASEAKPTKPMPQASSESSSSENDNEAGGITSPRPSIPSPRPAMSRPASRAVNVPMATYELPLELPESLRRTKQSELAKHGPPRLALRCGVRLNELGSLLVQQRRLREKLALLRSQEVQLSSWGGV
ncbi:hypothetical protein JG687_00004722 [Phytophthora cactorum]|uniref:C2 domain-containing protein n=1 Tax=Phytophthora cactorum TaxID=29920 RepID=A0A329S5D3_9STRA|nr:hypothetical protein PC112_g14985 [Phytophthora cactorum]KAG2814628.1 hypothetical protein PC111_g13891 [Phytophthora cactorum]KAG2852322.1 hypothetical protein PC113_g15120 [Phytophthora cactorum]KAG2923250.1 hypothetical protein PC117_g15771 [Phytophthora cactorum]KAG2983279.1 hypothetical protein PC118_g9501 [Phytophthora cactorum]